MTTIASEPIALPVPLRQEPDGAIRVGRSRVLLELVIEAFRGGATPEAIVQSYDTLRLADVYAVISYYLANPGPIDEYLRQREDEAKVIRAKIEAAQGPKDNLREILLTRAKAMEQQRAHPRQ